MAVCLVCNEPVEDRRECVYVGLALRDGRELASMGTDALGTLVEGQPVHRACAAEWVVTAQDLATMLQAATFPRPEWPQKLAVRVAEVVAFLVAYLAVLAGVTLATGSHTIRAWVLVVLYWAGAIASTLAGSYAQGVIEGWRTGRVKRRLAQANARERATQERMAKTYALQGRALRIVDGRGVARVQPPEGLC